MLHSEASTLCQCPRCGGIREPWFQRRYAATLFSELRGIIGAELTEANGLMANAKLAGLKGRHFGTSGRGLGRSGVDVLGMFWDIWTEVE